MRACGRPLLRLQALIYLLLAGLIGPAQAQIVFRNASDGIAVGGVSAAYQSHVAGNRVPGTSLTLTRPTGTAAGNVLVAQISVRGTGAVTAPAGWTLIASRSIGSVLTQNAYWKLAGAAEPADYSWSFAASVVAGGGVLRFSGVDTANPIDAAGSNAATATSMTAPSLTQSVGNSILLALYSSSHANDTHGNVTGMNDRYLAIASNPPVVSHDNGLAVGAKTQLNVNAGSTGTKVATVNTSARDHVAMLIVLRPSSAGTVTLNVPAGTLAGDTLVATVAVRPSTSVIVPPSGWTLVRSSTQANDVTMNFATYRRTATAAEPVSYGWNFSGTHTGAVGGMLAVGGVSLVAPVNVEGGNLSATGFTHTANSVTTTVANTLLVSSHSFTSSTSWTPPAGMTERVDRASLPPQDSLGIGLSMNTQVQAAAAATGSRAAVANSTGATDTGYGAAHLMALTPGASAVLNHLRIEHASGSGLTCTPSTLTVRGCANADCSNAYTAGFSVNLSSSAAGTLWADGSTLSVAAGQSSGSLRLQLPSPGSSLIGVQASVPTATGAVQCNFGTPSCSFTAADAGFQLLLANHRAETTTALTVRAVRKSDNAQVCVPAFGSVTRNLVYGCGYQNPATGSLAVRLAGQALNAAGNAAVACGTRSIATSFDANGQATLNLQYADVGQISVSAQYTGSVATNDSGLAMTGSVSAVVAPTDFAFSNEPTGPLTAGQAFGLRITARNAAGAATPNFGQEGEAVALSFARRQPTGAGASDGSFSGSASFSSGLANPVNLIWSEVGRGDVLAALADADYLGSAMNVQGATSAAGNAGKLGDFRPHYLRATLAPACTAFSFAGQPMAYTVAAYNAVDGLTRNYSAALSPVFAREVNFGEAPAVLALGGFAPASVAAADFSAGLASGELKYVFTSKASGPGLLHLRVTDSDAVGSATRSELEPTMTLRSGRLLLQSASGFAGRALNLPLRLEYWNAGSWLLASDDSCSAALLTAGTAAVAQSGRVDLQGVSSAAWSSPVQSIAMSLGVGQLRLNSSGAGAVDLALNLGAAASDRACLAAPRPASSGLNMPWLRSRFGSLHGCGAREDSDPSARASFGAATVEQQRRVHERQID